MLLAQGTVLEGKYRIERLLGAGGMGSVWVAEHTLLQRAVAIKILDATSSRRDPSAVQRFLREAQTAARVRDDHIVDVLDVGRLEDDTPFLVMELLEGETLTARIRRSARLPQDLAADLVDQLLAGLATAHAAGVVHRDIKPDNCFLTTRSRTDAREHLKLLDFGISKVTSEPREMRMTKTGVVMGTPYYMAPEQARGGKQIDHRCDLYAAGAILYECVTGRIPFDAENVNELLFKIVLERPAPPRSLAPEIDAAFEALILRAMEREPDARFQSASEFREALLPFLPARVSASPALVSDRPPSSPRSAQGTSAPSIPTVQTDRRVVRTPQGDAIDVAADTRPVESDPLPPTEPVGPSTPNGVEPLSSSGPVRAGTQPSPRNTPLYAAAAIAILAITGGGLYLAKARTDVGSARLPAEGHVAAARPGLPAQQAASIAPDAEGRAASSSPAAAATVSATSTSSATAATSAPLERIVRLGAPTTPPRPAPSVSARRDPPPIETVAPPPRATTPPTAPTLTAPPVPIVPPRPTPRPIDTTL